MEAKGFRKILLAVDGSACSQAAARQAAVLAGLCGAALVLVHAKRHIPEFIGEPYYQSMLDRINDDAGRLLAPYRKRLDEEGVAYQELLLEGDPAEAICTAARLEGCDLVVMGTRGLSDLGGTFLGSVSHRVLRCSPCPVLTVH